MTVMVGPKPVTTSIPLDNLPAISLAQLRDEAEFMTRIDRKYLISEDALAELLEMVAIGTRVLEIGGRRSFGYSTRYFDAENIAYFRALRKRRDRFKVRTRLYDERNECLLEVKLRDDRGRTVKRRVAHDPEQMNTLSTLDRAWLQSFDAVRAPAQSLRPTIATHYWRSTLVFPAGSGRMTLDRLLTFIGPDGCWRQLVGYCIVEIKGMGRPLSFDRQLWGHGYRPVPSSKFALGTSLLNPELPANRWQRLRRRINERSISGTEDWRSPDTRLTVPIAVNQSG